LAGAAGVLALGAVRTAGAQTLTVDASMSPSGNPHFWSACVGTGTASLTLRSDLQTHYKLANRELGFQRVRGHGVLNDDVGIFHWTGGTAMPTYDWSKFDVYLSAIAAANMRPIIELSFMPKDLAKSGDSRDVAKDLTVYKQFIQAVVQHAVDKFGAADVSNWYWEVWNEPNYSGFWNGTMDDYYSMYDAAAAGAVAALPNIMIGGPATTQGSTSQMTDFLKHMKTSGSRVTFLSSHAYPGGAGTTAPANFGIDDNNGRVNVLTTAGFTTDTMPSLNTEWNSAYTGQGGNVADNNVSMDSHVNAPFILKSVKLLADQDKGDKPPLSIFSYWVVSDVFGEYSGDAGSYIQGQGGGTLPFGEVFGLMTYQGIRKAAYNAFKMLNYTGTQRLSVTGGKGTSDGVDGMATINDDKSEVAVIVYDYYSTINTTGMDSVTVNVNNLPFAGKNVYVTQFAIDSEHSNPYSVWVSQGKPKAPSETQLQAMRQAQQLALATPVTTVAGAATYSATLTLPRQGAAMILLSLKRPVTGRDGLTDIEGEDYDGQSSVTKEDSSDDSMGQSIAGGSGAYVFYDNVDFSDSGVDNVQLRVNAQAATSLEFHADMQTGPLLGQCDVAATSGKWATQKCMLTPTTGVHTLYAVFGGTLRLNSMKFALGDGSSMGSGGSGGMSATGGVSAGGDAGMTSASGGMTATGGSATASGGSSNTTGGASTGGAVGTGGASATGGATANGGVGGGMGAGGSTAGGAGGSPPGGGAGPGGAAPSASHPSSDDKGCGCRVGPARSAPVDRAKLPAILALGLLLQRRRRARSRVSAARG
jgi:xylan 1,4-beta-xylosidase